MIYEFAMNRSLSSVALSPAGAVVVYLDSRTATPAGAAHKMQICG